MGVCILGVASKALASSDQRFSSEELLMGNDMAVGTVTVQIPIRAFWWVKHLAMKRHLTVEQWTRDVILLELNKTPDVDLSRAPAIGE